MPKLSGTYFQRINKQAAHALLRKLNETFIKEPRPVKDDEGAVVTLPDTGEVMMTPPLPQIKPDERDKKRALKKKGTITKLHEALDAKPFDTETVIKADDLEIDFKVIERHTLRDKVSIKHLGLPKRWAADVTFKKEKSRWIFGTDGIWDQSPDMSEPIVARAPQRFPHRDRSDMDALEDGGNV
jgi:hypothetical protein